MMNSKKLKKYDAEVCFSFENASGSYDKKSLKYIVTADSPDETVEKIASHREFKKYFGKVTLQECQLVSEGLFSCYIKSDSDRIGKSYSGIWVTEFSPEDEEKIFFIE